MSRQQQRRASDSSDNLIDEIIASKPRCRRLGSARETESFLRQYFEDVPNEDMYNRTPKNMGLAAVSHLDFGTLEQNANFVIRLL